MITETLRTTLEAVLSAAGVNLWLSEAETRDYPYVTYEMTVNPLRSKDGVYGSLGNTLIRVVSDNIEEAEVNLTKVVAAVEEGLSDNTYSSRLISIDKDCVDGVWTLELNYTLKQHS